MRRAASSSGGKLFIAAVAAGHCARAKPYHNAWTESFMGKLKAEMLQSGRFINTQRLHSSLNYRPPHHFEADFALSTKKSLLV